jgi:aerobic-type carbon monoxide dehydrogenase small subunit (CoxS/CutS family)
MGLMARLIDVNSVATRTRLRFIMMPQDMFKKASAPQCSLCCLGWKLTALTILANVTTPDVSQKIYGSVEAS